jgi:hypothetical protein
LHRLGFGEGVSPERRMISLTELRRRLNYDAGTGVFTWRDGKFAGRLAGSVSVHGYMQTSVFGGVYLQHRLAWLYMTGEWPKHEIDHISGEKADNRWANLRAADSKSNKENRRCANRNSAVGVLGVGKKDGRYRARIMVNRKEVYLGKFDSAEEAHGAYLAAKRRLHTGCTI